MIASTVHSRVKTRFDSSEESTYLYQKWNGGSPAYHYVQDAHDFRSEFIANEVGRGAFFKNAHHYVEEQRYPMQGTVFADYSQWMPNETWTDTPRKTQARFYANFVEWGAPSFDANSTTVPDINPITDNDWLEDLCAKGLRQMLPRAEDLSGGFNLVNFIAELRDIKQMFQLWKSSDTLAKNFSSGVLNWELAWKPFIGDCTTILTKISKIYKYIEVWNEQAASGEIFTRHADVSKYVQDYVEDVDTHVVSESQSGPHEISGWQHYHVTTSDVITRTKTKMFTHLYYRPGHIDTSDLLDMTSMWFDVLGGGDGLSIVWEAVPFSFVADWFFGIGDFLEQFEKDAFGVPYTIVDFGYSIKRTEEYYVDGWFELEDKDTGIRSMQASPAGYVRQYKKSYTRRRVHPPLQRIDEWSFDPLLTFQLPSWKQIWVGLNLAQAMRKG